HPPVLVLDPGGIRAATAPDVVVLDCRPCDSKAARPAEAVDRVHLLGQVAVELVQQAPSPFRVDFLLGFDDRLVDKGVAFGVAAVGRVEAVEAAARLRVVEERVLTDWVRRSGRRAGAVTDPLPLAVRVAVLRYPDRAVIDQVWLELEAGLHVHALAALDLV